MDSVLKILERRNEHDIILFLLLVNVSTNKSLFLKTIANILIERYNLLTDKEMLGVVQTLNDMSVLTKKKAPTAKTLKQINEDLGL